MRKRNLLTKAALIATSCVMMLTSIPMEASADTLTNMGTGLKTDINTSDTIALPIEIYDYDDDGMLFQFSEGLGVRNAVDHFGATFAIDYTKFTSDANLGTDLYEYRHWKPELNYSLTPSWKSSTYANYMRLTCHHTLDKKYGKNRASGCLTDFNGRGIGPSMNSIRYAVLVYRTDVENGKLGIGINYQISSDKNSGADGYCIKEVSLSTTKDTNWKYKVVDLNSPSIGTWSGSSKVLGLYYGLPMTTAGQWIDIAHIAYFSNKTDAERFGKYALTDGSDRGNHRAYGLLAPSTKEGGSLASDGYSTSASTLNPSIAASTDKVAYVKLPSASSGPIDIAAFSTEKNIGYKLFGTYGRKNSTDSTKMEAAVSTMGLLESSLSDEGLPVYKKEVVTYMAGLLKDTLEIPKRNSEGWLNYRYISGSTSSMFDGKDFAAALRARVNKTLGSYDNTLKKKENLVGTWEECESHIDNYYDAAYFMLNSIFVAGSYNEPQSTYNKLILSKATNTNNQETYVFDGGFTNASGESSVKYDTTNKTISNTSATHKMYNSSRTTNSPFLPITTRNNADGQTTSNYIQDGFLTKEADRATNPYTDKDYNYVMKGSGEFVYRADEDLFFEFDGDDDVYLFINGELVMDIGAAHSISYTKFNLNDYVTEAKAKAANGTATPRDEKLNLKEGNTYSFDFFYMERHGTGANIRISTNIKVTDPSMKTEKTAYQNGKEVAYGSIVDKTTPVEYGFVLTNNGDANLYNFSFKDTTIGLTLDGANGLTKSADTLCDPAGGPLDVTDLKAIISKDNVVIKETTFANATALKTFLASEKLEPGQKLEIRGFAHKLTETQMSKGVFDNTVLSEATDNVENKLQGQATMRVFIPADPMYYQWADHEVKIEKNKLISDVLAAAASEDNLLNDKVPGLSTDNVSKIELTTSGGNPITSDYVTVDSNNNVTVKYVTTGSNVFYVKITYKNSSTNQTATSVVPILVNVTNVADKVLVLDYGLKVDLTENGEIFKGDSLTVLGRNTASQLLAVGNEQPSYAPNNISFKKSTNGELTGTYGNFKLAGQTLTYEPTSFLEGLDSIWTAIHVKETDYTGEAKLGEVDINNEVQMYKQVSTLPASIVYYEDVFPAIHYSDGEKDITNTFTTIGTQDPDLQQSVNQEEEYGSDAAYENGSNANVSGGTITKITVNGNEKIAYFDFAGTGFELISRTNATDDAMIVVKVVKLDDEGQVMLDSKNKPIVEKTIPVDMTYDNNSNGGAEEINQVPVIRVDDLNSGKHRVEITSVPDYDWDNWEATGNLTVVPSEIYIDGLRIFNPLLDNEELKENYNEKEKGASIVEIRDQILNGTAGAVSFDGKSLTFGTSTITWVEDYDGSENTKYVSNKVNNIDEYLLSGPNNELYMYGDDEGSALVFYVKETGAGVHNLQIALRGLDAGKYIGSASTGIKAPIEYSICGSAADEYIWMPLVTAVSGTEQYYEIDYTKCPKVEIGDETCYQVAVRVAKNTDATPSMVSYSSLKLNGLDLVSINGEATELVFVNGILPKEDNEEEGTKALPALYNVSLAMRGSSFVFAPVAGDFGDSGNDSDSGNEGTGSGNEGNTGTGSGNEGNTGTGNEGTGSGNEGNTGTGNEGTGSGNEGTGSGNEENTSSGNEGTGSGNGEAPVADLKEETSKDSSTVETGDHNNILLVVLALVVSGLTVAFVGRKRFLAMFLAVALLAGNVLPAEAASATETALGALLDTYKTQSGSFKLTSDSRIFLVVGDESGPSADLKQTAQLIQQQFAADKLPTSSTLDIVWGPESYARTGDIVLKIDKSLGYDADSYTLNVAAKAVVTGKDSDGLLYGANMLQKYFRAVGGTTLSGFTAVNEPDTIERTVMVDCARKYFTKEWIINYIREMSWMGYNTLELHFSDDGGFRADIWDEKYFKSENGNDFSWLCGGESAYWVHLASNGNGKYKETNTSGHFSASDLIEIFEVAKQYHIDVIPSLDTPGHSEYMCTEYYEYIQKNPNYEFTYDGVTYTKDGVKENGTSKTYAQKFGSGIRANFNKINFSDKNPGNEGTDDSIDAANPVARAFVFAMLQDFAEFFEKYAGSTEFNIGADEVLFADRGIGWEEYASKQGFGSTKYDTFIEYLNSAAKVLQDKGYKVRVFNDCLYRSNLGDLNVTLNKDIEVVFWTAGHTAATSLTSRGHSIYNGIQYYNYYVLRRQFTKSGSTYVEGADALDPSSSAWSFNYASAQHNYDEWNPSRMRGKDGKGSDVTDSKLKGAYYFIWCDFAGFKTEQQIWNGIDANGKFNIRERMWANSTKMWNWDINSSVTYSNFASTAVRMGDFPGLVDDTNGCSTKATYVKATEPERAYLADHTALKELLETKISLGIYTDESYAVYEACYNAAQEVDRNYGATEAQVKEAIDNLQAAKNGLKVTDYEIMVIGKAMINGQAETIGTWGTNIISAEHGIYLKPVEGYTFDHAETGTYEELPSKDGSGFLKDATLSNQSVVVWYKSTPDANRLNDLIAEEITDSTGYTEESWNAYTEALAAAKSFAANANTKQEQIAALVTALENARTALVTDTPEGGSKIISIEKLEESTKRRNNAMLKIKTSADVQTITVDGVELAIAVGRVQTLKTGEVVKVWLVSVPVYTTGEQAYTVNAGTVSETVNITAR